MIVMVVKIMTVIIVVMMMMIVDGVDDITRYSDVCIASLLQ